MKRNIPSQKKYIFLPLQSSKPYPDDWHTIHADYDEMFEMPLYGETLEEAENLIQIERDHLLMYPWIKKSNYNYKIERIPLNELHTFRKKKISKAKPKRKIVKKKSCGCK
jgi:hypothetical protein